MTKTFQRLYKLGILAVFIACGAANITNALEVGDTVPYVVLEGMSENGGITVAPISSTERPEHSFTLVEFFSTEDEVSLQNLRTITAQSQDLIKDVTTQLVAVDSDVLKVKQFREDYKEDFKYSLYFDPTQGAMRAFGVTTVPTVFVIDQDSKILFKSEGLLSEAKVNLLRVAIGYNPPANPLNVGDFAPEVVLPSRLPTGEQRLGDIRKPLRPTQRFTVLSLNTIYSQEAATNTVAYRELAAIFDYSTTVRYVALDADTNAVMNFINKYPSYFQYPIVLDTAKVSQTLFAETLLPTTYVLDVNGVVLFKRSGLLSPAEIEEIRRIIR